MYSSHDSNHARFLKSSTWQLLRLWIYVLKLLFDGISLYNTILTYKNIFSSIYKNWIRIITFFHSVPQSWAYTSSYAAIKFSKTSLAWNIWYVVPTGISFMHNSIWNAEKCNKKPYVYDDYYNPLKMKRAHTQTMHDRGCKSTLKTLRLHKIVTMWNLTCFTKEMLKRGFILLQPFEFHKCVIYLNE